MKAILVFALGIGCLTASSVEATSTKCEVVSVRTRTRPPKCYLTCFGDFHRLQMGGGYETRTQCGATEVNYAICREHNGGAWIGGCVDMNFFVPTCYVVEPGSPRSLTDIRVPMRDTTTDPKQYSCVP